MLPWTWTRTSSTCTWVSYQGESEYECHSMVGPCNVLLERFLSECEVRGGLESRCGHRENLAVGLCDL